MRRSLLVVWAVVSLSQPVAGAAALRGLTVRGRTCWAVGDAGCVLRSGDAGLTWQRLAVPSPAANFQSVQATDGGALLFGGGAIPGHPAAQGLPAVLQTTDGGDTFRPVGVAPAGWLYGGCFADRTAVVFGQASYAVPAGILHTTSGGRYWNPAAAYSRGYVTGGHFLTPGRGYLVGGASRIVSLRNLAEPRYHPPPIRSPLGLRAVRFADELTCWCVGDDGSIFRSRPAGRPWDPIPLTLPAGLRRCADLEAVVFASRRRAWLAGGLIGVVPYTANGGGSWTLLPAPSPGAVHAMALAPDEVLLAAGDGERIWRSADGGKTWRLVHGRRRTDVLFVVAAGDRSVYPAIAAHALAGASVAVVYATHLPGEGVTPPDQPLRAAAAAAGADGVTTLTEFPSISTLPAGGDLSADAIVRRWSERLDIPAAGEMVRQLAAAIRLYRPAVLAVGPDAKGCSGRAAENHLVSRLAQEAAALAADADALRDHAKAHLTPWSVKRVFAGLAANEQWAGPWQRLAAIDRARVAAAFPTERFPGEDGLPLGLIAQRGVWCLPSTGLLDRPGQASAYRCSALEGRVRLFTTSLGKARLVLSAGEGSARLLATCGQLRAAVAAGRTYSAVAPLTAALKAAETPDAAALAADRLLLTWHRLLDEGRLIEADHVLAAFAKGGKHHPLSQKMDVLALALAASGECKAQLRALGLPADRKPAVLEKAVAGFAAWPAWSLGPAGQMLHAKALAATGQLVGARKVLARLAREPYPAHWRRCAMLELGSGELVDAALRGRRRTTAELVAERGRLDGRLDEQSWRQAPRLRLGVPYGAGGPAGRDRTARRPAGAEPVIQVVRSTARFLIFGVRLPVAPGRQWEVDLALDADRDAWTQIVLHWDTRGRQGASLVLRHGPAASLVGRTFQVKGWKTQTQWTFEVAVPLAQFTLAPPVEDVWNFQARAVAHDLARRTSYYFQPQSDARLLPERYGLLKLPADAPTGPAR